MNDSIQIHNWEILHTYTTYYVNHIPDLEKVAKNFIKSGFAYSVMISNGKTYHKTKNGHQEGITTFTLSSDRSFMFEFKSFNSENAEILQYAFDTWKRSSITRSAELRLFGEQNILPEYLRANIGPCIFKSEKLGEYIFYPTITLYETGIIILQFRFLSPDDPVDLENFINDYVNIFMHTFSEVKVPPYLAQIAPLLHEAEVSFDSLSERLKALELYKKHCLAVDLLTETGAGSEHEFYFAPLGAPDHNQEETLSTLAITIFGAVGYLFTIEEFDLKYAISGYPKFPDFGIYWKSTPHVILLRHSNQESRSLDNQAKNELLFNSILNRTLEHSSQLNLPPNLRLFNDYCLYVTSSITLCVWSKNAIDISNDFDENMDIYNYIAQTLLLDYGDMLHRKLLYLTTQLNNPTQVFNTYIEANELKFRMTEIGPYGEIRNLLTQGWKAMGVEALQSQISENLRVVDSHIKFTDSKRNNFTTIILAILFGLLSAQTFASNIIAPIWREFRLWEPRSQYLTELFFFITTGIILCILIGFILLIMKMINKRNY